jgi:hypothetical protein
LANKTYIIHGVAHWAKILGPPRDNDFTGEREWSIDVTPDAEGRELLKELGLSDRLREPKDSDKRTESFLSFRHREFKADGEKADPIRVVKADATQWNKDNDGLIGNDSEVNAKFVVRDYGKGKKQGMYLRAIQVVKLVPYVTQDFAPVQSDDEYFADEPVGPATVTPLPEGLEPVVDDDLNDDVPE